MNKNVVQLQDFGFRYSGSESFALQGIDLEIKEGEFIGLIGPSGAGKSSLGFALSGFIPHYFPGDLSGSQLLFDQEASACSLSQLTGRIGLVVQNPFTQISGARYTVREEVAFGLENLGIAREKMEQLVNESLHMFGLQDLRDRSPYELSGGQQQRLALASIFAMQPDLLILDEPTSQLDPAGSQDVFESVHALTEISSTTVVLISHKLEWLAEFADRVLAVVAGQIQLQGSPEKVLTDPSLEEWGIGSTQYTRAARLAAASGHASIIDLPVTLNQAIDFFS
jgi:energy-coupling factor transporter ATP-binding protein EcfA2